MTLFDGNYGNTTDLTKFINKIEFKPEDKGYILSKNGIFNPKDIECIDIFNSNINKYGSAVLNKINIDMLYNIQTSIDKFAIREVEHLLNKTESILLIKKPSKQTTFNWLFKRAKINSSKFEAKLEDITTLFDIIQEEIMTINNEFVIDSIINLNTICIGLIDNITNITKFESSLTNEIEGIPSDLDTLSKNQLIDINKLELAMDNYNKRKAMFIGLLINILKIVDRLEKVKHRINVILNRNADIQGHLFTTWKLYMLNELRGITTSDYNDTYMNNILKDIK